MAIYKIRYMYNDRDGEPVITEGDPTPGYVNVYQAKDLDELFKFLGIGLNDESLVEITELEYITSPVSYTVNREEAVTIDYKEVE